MHLLELELLDHLFAGKDLAVAFRMPAEEEKIVEERLREITLLAVLADESGAVALRIGLALLIDDHREMPVLRHGRT